MRKLLLFVAGLMMASTPAYAQSLSPSGFLRVPTAESPQGFTRGTNSVSWMADDSVVGGSHMIVGITPTLILRSIIGNDTTFSEDTSGNTIFKSTKGQKYTFMFNNSQIILSQSGFYLYSSPTAKNALSLWTSGTESDIQAGGDTNSILGLYSRGTGTIYLHNKVQLGGDNYTSDTTKCGSLSNSVGCIQITTPGNNISYVPVFGSAK